MLRSHQWQWRAVARSVVGIGLVGALLAMNAPAAGALAGARGYELVSPVEKNGGDVTVDTSRTRAAADGSAVGFTSLVGFADVGGTGIGIDYMSVRGGEPGTTGWATHAITPQQGSLSTTVATFQLEPFYHGEFSPDLNAGVFRAVRPIGDAPNVVNVTNLYVRRDLRTPGAGNYQLLTDAVTPLAFSPAQAAATLPADSSADYSHVSFETSLNLTSDARGSSVKLYEWADGTVRLVGVRPDGTAARSSIAGLGAAAPARRYTWHTMSSDGRHVFFVADPTSTSQAYVRIDGSVSVQLNAPERSVPEPPSAAQLWSASEDGRRAFFTTAEGLVEGDDNRSRDLYMWEQQSSNERQQLIVSATSGTFTLTLGTSTTGTLAYDAPAAAVEAALAALPPIGAGNVSVTGGPGDGAGSRPYAITFVGALAGVNVAELAADATGLVGGAATASVSTVDPVSNLTRLSIDSDAPDVPEVQTLIGTSDDGRSVYFTAKGQLVPALSGGASFPTGAGIYLWRDGVVTYIGWLTENNLDADFNSWGKSNGSIDGHSTARVTPDGRTLLFMSHLGEGLRGQGGFTGFDHSSPDCTYDALLAGNCRELYVYDSAARTLGCASCNISGQAGGDAFTANRANTGGTLLTSHLSHALSDDGKRVFFTTRDALVPEDRNGKLDVYEYDVSTNRQHLISSGASTSDSYFLDASASGDDVFFTTRERLVGWDVDGSYDLYDARVGGGMPDPVQATGGCSGDPCQGPLAVQPLVTGSGSAQVRGVGNERSRLKSRAHRTRRCKKGKVRKVVRGKVRCVRKATSRESSRQRRAK